MKFDIFSVDTVAINVAEGQYDCPRDCHGCFNKDTRMEFVGFETMKDIIYFIKSNFPRIKNIQLQVDFFEDIEIVEYFMENNFFPGIDLYLMAEIDNFPKSDKNRIKKFLEKYKNVSIQSSFNISKPLSEFFLFGEKVLPFLSLMNETKSMFSIDFRSGKSISLEELKIYYVSIFKFYKIALDILPTITFERGLIGSNDMKKISFDDFSKNYFGDCYILGKRIIPEINYVKIFFHGPYCKLISENNFGTIRSSRHDIEKAVQSFINILEKEHPKIDLLPQDNLCEKCVSQISN